jgi:uncharacterized protein YjiS (DUF1127 family)
MVTLTEFSQPTFRSSGFARSVRFLHHALLRFFAKGAQLAEFRRLDQHMLDDIGLVRTDIEDMVERIRSAV